MHWFREARPEIITQCSRIRVANKLETESFLCVKCCFIFRLRRKKNNKWQQKHGQLQAQFQFYAALFATRWIFMPRIPPSREKPNIFAVFFISLGSWGNYVDKNLSLPRRTTVYLIFFKKRLWYLRYGVLRRLTPLCSLVHFPVAYWSFFWDCLWDCVSKRRPIDFPFRGFCRSRGLSLTINIKHVIK